MLIGVYKLVTATLSVVLGVGLFRLFQGDVSATLAAIVRGLRFDPENAFVHSLISRLAGIDRGRLLVVEAGTFAYAILHVIEGVGILQGKRWGGALIILATSSLIPVECFEIVRRQSLVRIIALVLNTAIVVYLVMERGRLHGNVRRPRREAEPGARGGT